MTSRTKHYDDKYVLTFNPDDSRERYAVDGPGMKNLPFSGTTSITGAVLAKQGLTWWAAKCAGDYIQANLKPGVALDELQIDKLVYDAIRAHTSTRDSAAAAGTWVHSYMAARVAGKQLPDPINLGMLKAVKDADKWLAAQKLTPLRIEQPVLSLKMELAGTPDIVGELNGVLSIIDWKTGSGLYYEHLIQMALYAVMYEEEFDRRIDQIVLVNCSVKSAFKVFATRRTQKLRHDAKKIFAISRSIGEFTPELRKGTA